LQIDEEKLIFLDVDHNADHPKIKLIVPCLQILSGMWLTHSPLPKISRIFIHNF